METNNNNAYINLRVVLTEKINPHLNECINYFSRVLLFSTEVIPLSNKEYLIFQRSKPVIDYIFSGFVKKPEVSLVRVIILNEVLIRNLDYMVTPAFRFSLFFENLFRSYATRYMEGHPRIDSLFSKGNFSSYTELLVIPDKAISEFVSICLNCHYKSKNKVTGNNERLSLYRMEDIPALRIRGDFSPMSESDGTWLKEFDIFTQRGQANRKAYMHKIGIFSSYASFYDKGLWKKVTNKNRNLNGVLNRLE